VQPRRSRNSGSKGKEVYLTVATKLSILLRRYPVVTLALLAALALLGACFGHHGVRGLWDGPI
jgi:hypothetical protein